ncbi:unnamed protein product, partial [Aphanomyces euteiches]
MAHSRSSVTSFTAMSARNSTKSIGRSSAYRTSKHAKKRSKAAGVIFANLGAFNMILLLSALSFVLVSE